MTSDERAAAVVKEDGGVDYYYEGWGREESIAAAIRAAEDEALERAAKGFDLLPEWDSESITHQVAAAFIRSLKSKGAP